jgi:hypothetical protein
MAFRLVSGSTCSYLGYWKGGGKREPARATGLLRERARGAHIRARGIFAGYWTGTSFFCRTMGRLPGILLTERATRIELDVLSLGTSCPLFVAGFSELRRTSWAATTDTTVHELLPLSVASGRVPRPTSDRLVLAIVKLPMQVPRTCRVSPLLALLIAVWRLAPVP